MLCLSYTYSLQPLNMLNLSGKLEVCLHFKSSDDGVFHPALLGFWSSPMFGIPERMQVSETWISLQSEVKSGEVLIHMRL